MASLSILKQLTALTAEATAREMPQYQTKRESVARLKSFEECVKESAAAKDVILSKRLERSEFDRDVEQYRQKLDEDVERAMVKIATMKTHIVDIVREVWPDAEIEFNDSLLLAPSQIEDHVFETPPPIPQEE